MNRRVLIVGGMAGGASCAARLRRLDERAEIVLFDRNPWVSLATCGLPYFLGGVVREEAKLFAATPKTFCEWFHVDVRPETEVAAIDRKQRTLRVRHLGTRTEYEERYDALVLSPGAGPVRPPWPGLDLPGVFFARTLPDIRALSAWIERTGARRAAVIGGGLIGLETTENLAARGLAVTLIEKVGQVAPVLDAEMAEPLCRRLEENRVDVRLGERVSGLEAGDGALAVNTWARRRISADVVVVATGGRPETTLARAAGLEIGERGGIEVDSAMRTSDPSIWAVGDAVEVAHLVTGERCLIPQAGPASRQARIAADSICGRASTFRGVQGTIAFRCFGLTAAVTGATEAELRRIGEAGFEAVYLHPADRAAYFPESAPIHMKLLFSTEDGRILGAQAVGEQGADKRIDVIALALQKGGTVFDLEQAELCYAPPFGAVRDPVNLAGMVAANVLRGDMPLASWRELPSTQALILDVRDRDEYAADHIEGAVNIPLSELRRRMRELPNDREIWVNCGVGQRAYIAVRMLVQNGFAARNLAGGYATYCGWS